MYRQRPLFEALATFATAIRNARSTSCLAVRRLENEFSRGSTAASDCVGNAPPGALLPLPRLHGAFRNGSTAFVQAVSIGSLSRLYVGALIR